MKSKILLVLVALFVVSVSAFAVDPTGKWTGEAPGRGGGAGQPVTFQFTVMGTTLNGTMAVGEGMPNPITNGKVVDANTITFTAAGGGGGRGGAGGGGGAPGGGGARGGGAPPAGGNNFAQAPAGGQGGAPGAGAGGGGGRGGGQGGRGGGGAQNYTGKFTSADKLSMSRVPAPPADGAAAPAAPAGAAAPAPVTFELTRSK